MKPEKQTRRLGLAAVIFALILRLAADGPLAEAVAAVSSPEWISFALFLMQKFFSEAENPLDFLLSL